MLKNSFLLVLFLLLIVFFAPQENFSKEAEQLIGSNRARLDLIYSGQPSGLWKVSSRSYVTAELTVKKEYSDFATPEELITKNQVLTMSWQKLNGPFGGQGYTIRFSPNNSNKIIVTDSFAGIHISNDKGLTWTESDDGIDARTAKSGDAVPVFVTTIDPNNPDRIWCGVKNAMGVFLSTDGGMSWQHKDNGLPGGEDVEIRGLAVKPGDSNIIFAAGDFEEIGPPMGAFQRTKGIVYRTTDGGENWTQVLRGANLFKDIIIDPKKSKYCLYCKRIF